MTTVQVHVHQSFEEIDPAGWNRLFGRDHPFTRHEFLSALERSGSADKNTGWQALHLVLRDETGAMRAAMPLYLKSHSMGEYVFDWAWADFWQRSGGSYYPKLLTAVPFTPCVGPRIGCLEETDRAMATAAFARAAQELAQTHRLSSWHLLFADTPPDIQQPRLLQRDGWRYQWQNAGYADFDAFLASLSSKKRKNIRQELRRLQEAGVSFRTLEAEDIRPEHWDHFYRLYQSTYLRHGQVGYLQPEFFSRLAASMPEHLVLIQAVRGEACIGAALYLRSADTLFGRYWGCSEPLPGLHFATCYYQGIEYCIRRGLQVCDPGVQGEHKIARGFLPVRTHSWHWLAAPELARAVGVFLDQERDAVEGITEQLAQRSPYRQP